MDWNVKEINTDYVASFGDMVLVDMGGKTAPDTVTITLPAPTLKSRGQQIGVATTNIDGAVDDARLLITTAGGIILQTDSADLADVNGGQFWAQFISTGTNWAITASNNM